MFNNNQSNFTGQYNSYMPFSATSNIVPGPMMGAPATGYNYNQGYNSQSYSNSNVQMNSQGRISEQELTTTLKNFDHLLSVELPKNQRALLASRDIIKNQTTKYISDLQQRNQKMRTSDNSRFEKVSKQCIEIQERNDEIRKELLRVQDDVVRTASNLGRVNRQPEWEAELYRRVSELKRVLSEADRKLYEIQMVGKPQLKQEATTEKPLKELEHAIQILAVEASKKRVECDTLVKVMRS